MPGTEVSTSRCFEKSQCLRLQSRPWRRWHCDPANRQVRTQEHSVTCYTTSSTTSLWEPWSHIALISFREATIPYQHFHHIWNTFGKRRLTAVVFPLVHDLHPFAVITLSCMQVLRTLIYLSTYQLPHQIWVLSKRIDSPPYRTKHQFSYQTRHAVVAITHYWMNCNKVSFQSLF
jgi:hypothetical protein